jgi:UDP-N-acetylmuramoyl-L-alanyl-D-glutamate--2,6-diaminopimelate ligase
MDSYFEAKARLFSELLDRDGVAVINQDDAYAQRLISICKERAIRTVSFGRSGEDIKLTSCVPKPKGQHIEITVNGKEYSLTLPLVGDFQVMNALCALGLVLAIDNNSDKYAPLLEKLQGVPGRLQLVSNPVKGAIYVDYAHKPAALETVLKTLRPHTQGRLVCLFGCGGDRDSGKRPMMGKIADDLADVVVVTDDNPRSEDAAQIRKEIITTCPDAKEIGNRAEAIRWCVDHLQEGDVLLVAGKGHEEGQIIGGTVEPFNDVEEVQKSIKAQS